MRRFLFLGLLPFAVTAAAQTMDHSSMPGMVMPGGAPEAKKVPSAQHNGPDTTPQPPAANRTAPTDHSSMPGMSKPAAQSGSHDHSSMPGMSTPAPAPSHDHSSMPGMDMAGPSGNTGGTNEMEIPHNPPPPPPSDHAADHFFAPAAMADARAQLNKEHGGDTISTVMVNLAEYQFRNGADGFRWDGQAWYGGDIQRLVIKSEGEGTRGKGVESGELQALYSRAVGVYTDAQFGLRQDFAPLGRTYVTAGIQSLVPYWFDIETALFLSTKGELMGRAEGTYDVLLTNRLIMQPRVELNFAAQNTLETRTGSGLSNAELGLRLRYEITREFAPYIGISWDRKVGQTADYSRALGQEIEATSFVVGIRTFF